MNIKNSSISNDSAYDNRQFSSFWLLERTLSVATTPGQIGPVNNGNEGVCCIPQSSSFTRASYSDCLASYLGYSLRESNPSAEMQSVYSRAQPWKWYLEIRTKLEGGFLTLWLTYSTATFEVSEFELQTGHYVQTLAKV